jgi:hypothetical protein
MQMYRLPSFLDFLKLHYTALYQEYSGRLTELFPSSEHTADNLYIADDDEEHPEEDATVRGLWQNFEQQDA